MKRVYFGTPFFYADKLISYIPGIRGIRFIFEFLK